MANICNLYNTLHDENAFCSSCITHPNVKSNIFLGYPVDHVWWYMLAYKEGMPGFVVQWCVMWSIELKLKAVG